MYCRTKIVKHHEKSQPIFRESIPRTELSQNGEGGQISPKKMQESFHLHVKATCSSPSFPWLSAGASLPPCQASVPEEQHPGMPSHRQEDTEIFVLDTLTNSQAKTLNGGFVMAA